MEDLINSLTSDVRYKEGLKACINCGTCTAICPAAEFYNYHPRNIIDTIQSKNTNKIIELLKSESIWYCGECMSCKTRCPRGNAPGLIIMALRSVAQDFGYFVESEKGRQQLAIKRTIGEWIINHGYCLYLEGVGTDLHPEQGPVWDWYQNNFPKIIERLGGNYKGDGPGILRKIPQESMDEIRAIFDITGATERFNKIEKFSSDKAKQLNFSENSDKEYFNHIYTYNSNNHNTD